MSEFVAWYEDLSEDDSDAVEFVVDLLEAKGVSLGYPYSSQIKGSKLKLRELGVQSAGQPIRILYAFDPQRQAVLLLGGCKAGDDRWYETNVPLAERRFQIYLKE